MINSLSIAVWHPASEPSLCVSGMFRVSEKIRVANFKPALPVETSSSRNEPSLKLTIGDHHGDVMTGEYLACAFNDICRQFNRTIVIGVQNDQNPSIKLALPSRQFDVALELIRFI